mgnify:FL=1
MDPSTLVFLILAGLAGGFIGAQVGGGALVTLPALLFLGLTPSGAVSSNIISALTINVVALFTYNHIKKLKIKEVIMPALSALAGSVVGANLVLNVNKEILSQVMAILLVVAGLFVLAKPRHVASIKSQRIIRTPFGFLIFFILGIYGGFLSASITTLFVILLVFLGENELKAIEKSVFITAVLLVGAAVVFIKQGTIQYNLAWPLAAASAVGSYAGAKTALRWGSRWLKILLALAVIFAAVKLLI